MTYDANNIFAKILRGEIPCHKVYEDADTIAFLDVMPQAPGHTLVVPKTPARNILDADPQVLSRLLPVAQTIARAAMTAFSADGISVFQYSEQAGGQSVFHLHVHVVPRHTGIRMQAHTGKMEDGAVLAANAEKLRRALSG